MGPSDVQRPMRIVYVSLEYPPQYGGGIGTYVRAMAGCLAERGHDVTVVTVTDESLPQREMDGRVRLLRLPLKHATGEGPVATLRTWQNRSDAVADALRRMIRRVAIDVIEFCDYRGEGASFLAACGPGERPLSVVRLHTPLSVLNTYNASHVRQQVLEAFEHEALRLADRLVSPSHVLMAETRSRLGEDVSIEHSPHPVDPMFLDAPAADGASGKQGAERPEVLYVGRFEQRKGVETLARAAERFLDACPAARLVMVGGDTHKGPGQPSMRAVVERLIPRRLRGRVELIDRIPREQLIGHYRAARFCVFPSHFENFPNTCLEAMALGRCVIGTSHSGMAEIIEPGVSGVVVPSADVDALVAAMIDLWNMPASQRQAMEAAAHARIRDRYRPEVIAEQWERLYGRLVDEHEARRAREDAAAGDEVGPAAAAVACQAPAAHVIDESPADDSVAVIIPCYNHGRYLPDAIASVRAQTHPPAEIIVVDDGSDDPHTVATLECVGGDGVRVIRQANAGLAAARNTGVQASRSAYFVPLDADDKLDPHFIERLLPPLRDDATLGYAYGQVRFFGDQRGEWACPAYDPRRLLIENLSVATAVIRRRAFDEAGGYSPDMVHGFEDWDFWIALLAIGYYGVCVPEPLFWYRKHAGGSMLADTQRHRAEMIHLMIEHHQPLFAATLALSLTGKDRLFFEAHTDAWRLRSQVAAGGGAPAATTIEDELYNRLLAKAELDHIENSRLWRAVQRVKHMPPLGWVNRWRFGPEWDRPPGDVDPRQRLREIKSGRTYRLIQTLKRTPFYRWYARRRYGADFTTPAAG